MVDDIFETRFHEPGTDISMCMFLKQALCQMIFLFLL